MSSYTNVVVGLDIETTGLDLQAGHRLIQIGLAFEHRLILHHVMPLGPITYDPEAMAVHGISQELIGQSLYQTAVDRAIEHALKEMGIEEGSLTAVGFNVGSFDLVFVKHELPHTARFFSHRSLDLNTLIWAVSHQHRMTFAETHEYVKARTEYALRHLPVQWHDALYDARAARTMLQMLQRSLAGGVLA